MGNLQRNFQHEYIILYFDNDNISKLNATTSPFQQEDKPKQDSNIHHSK
jgi:hypothetical protein